MKISILVPAYKATYFKECIDSIIEQSYPDWELIILNDCSPENLDTIMKHYHDDRIKYYKNSTNVGALDVVNNWNKCLSYASGDYVICMGDDDKLKTTCLEEYVRLIKQYPNRYLYHAWTEIIDENSNVIALQEPRPIEESAYSLLYYRWHGRKQYIGDFLFETTFLKSNGGFYYMPMAWWSDDISACIAASKNGVVNSQIPLFQYRVNSRTLSNTGNVVLKLKASEMFKNWVKDFLECEATTAVDRVLRKNLIEEFNEFFFKEKLYKISEDIINNGCSRFLFWLNRNIKYKLTIKSWAFIIMDVVKRKNKAYV